MRGHHALFLLFLPPAWLALSPGALPTTALAGTANESISVPLEHPGRVLGTPVRASALDHGDPAEPGSLAWTLTNSGHNYLWSLPGPGTNENPIAQVILCTSRMK